MSTAAAGALARQWLTAGRLLVAVGVLVLAQVAWAAPASAHAELVGTTPPNGARLESRPAEVTLEFTESVGLLDNAIRLLDADGDTIETPDPVVDGSTVRWPMPDDLPDGAYLVNWRVVSGDSHPVAGAFSFGVGPDITVDPVAAHRSPTVDAPWPVVAARFGGYLGFTVIAGVAALVLLCWRAGRAHRRTQALLRTGFVVAGAATLLAYVLQGPYAAGAPLTELADPQLLAQTSHTDFGAWTQIRFFVVLAMAAVLWPVGSLEHRSSRFVAGGGVLAVAATFSGTSHAAASDDLVERVVDSAHVLTAGVWVGGLVAFVVAGAGQGGRPGRDAFAAFSRVALLSVVLLVATGTLNSLYRLDTVDALYDSDYGRLLTAKLVLVAVALGSAALSRRGLLSGGEPWTTVRVEAAATVAVLAVTGVVASVSPPSSRAAAAATPRSEQVLTVEVPLQDGASARVAVDPPTTEGSRVTVTLHDQAGGPPEAGALTLTATLDSQDIGPVDIPLKSAGERWQGRFTFPLPGTWTFTLTVEDRRLAAVVATGEVDIADE